MVYIVSNGVGRSYGIKKYRIDFESDVELLPRNVPMGCTAFCIENSKTYMINSAGKWIEISVGSTTSSGSGNTSGGGNNTGSGDGGNTGTGGGNNSNSGCCCGGDKWVDMDENNPSGGDPDSGDDDEDSEYEYHIIYDGGEEV